MLTMTEENGDVKTPVRPSQEHGFSNMYLDRLPQPERRLRLSANIGVPFTL